MQFQLKMYLTLTLNLTTITYLSENVISFDAENYESARLENSTFFCC